jgi:hypothetical protein
LVEGILMELEDGHRGEVVLLDIAGSGCSDLGLLAFVKRDAEARPVILDLAGTRRPDWEPLVLGKAAARHQADPAEWGLDEGAEERHMWDSRVRELLEPLESEGKLMAVAGFRLLP